MSTKPLVSVCLPLFNGANYLEVALPSVLNQTYDNFELIITDDGSTDSSLEIIEKFAKKDRRIRLYKNPVKLGLFENYNEAIRKAKGRYIKPYAHDDIFEPTILEKMVNILEAEPLVALVNCARDWIDEDGKSFPSQTELDQKMAKPFKTDVLRSGREIARETFRETVNWLGEPVTMMFRKEQAGTGFDARFAQLGDIDYWYRILEHGDYYYISEPLCRFRKHASQHTAKIRKTLKSVLDWPLLASKHRDLIAAVGETETQCGERFTLQLINAITDELYSTPPTDSTKYSQLIANDLLACFEQEQNQERNFSTEYEGFAISALREAAKLQRDRKELEKANQILSKRLGEVKASLINNEAVITKKMRESERKAAEREEALHEEIEELRDAISRVGNSFSWKVTAPFRNAKRLLR
jgi:GT2 family glycosyltransferase